MVTTPSVKEIVGGSTIQSKADAYEMYLKL
jgi:hypothetical protein